VKEFTSGENGLMNFLLFPGLSNGLIAIGVEEASINDRHMPYTNHGLLLNGGANDLAQDPANEVAKWRVVSQAMKFTLTNNSDENDGWWEAIRVMVNTQTDQITNREGFEFIGGGPADQFNVYIGSTSTTDLPAMNLGITNMVEHPTYVSGKVRDLHRHTFDLMPCGNDHEFNRVPYQLTNGGSKQWNSMIDNDGYDAILVRVHGRGGTTSPTRLMAHVVCNQEVVYQESASAARYHSESDAVPFFDSVKRKRTTGNHKAAKKNRTAIVTVS
jgi:hypothetical protein